LRDRIEVHLAVEDAVRLSVEHALIELAAKTVRLRVDDLRLMIAMLFAVEHVQPVQRRAAPCATERRIDVRACERATGGEREREVVAVSRLTRLDRADVKRAHSLALHLV